jgi:hypothetical protein
MKVTLALLCLLLPLSAIAQIKFSTAANPTYATLDGQTFPADAKLSVRLAGCKPPVTYVLDGVTQWPENVAPCDWQGDLDGAPNFVSFLPGKRTLTVAGLSATFTIGSVPQPPTNPNWTGGFTLGWSPTTLHTDGTPTDNLAGYRVYLGSSPTSLAVKATVTTTSYAFTGLTAGTWYAAVEAYQTDGARSDLSTVVSRTLTATTPPPTCPAQPAPESRTQTCAAPTIGSWTQSHSWTSAPAPACWTADQWLPPSAPDGVCASPPQLVTADTKAYQFKGTTSPLALVGMVAAGAPCGPATQVISGVKYCHITKSQVDMVVWPTDLTLTDFWAKASP